MFKLIIAVTVAVAASTHIYSGSGSYNNCDAWSNKDCPHSGETTQVGSPLTFTTSTISGHTEGDKLRIVNTKFTIKDSKMIIGNGKTHGPTAYPTTYPTKNPTKFPTAAPTEFPTATPTAQPTAYPTSRPTMLIEHLGRPCKHTTCHYDGIHTRVFTTTLKFQSNTPLKSHERWHCEKFNGVKGNCKCVCGADLHCNIRHHHPSIHASGYSKKYHDTKHCVPTAAPTAYPTSSPTANPTAYPTSSPTANPTGYPTTKPTPSPPPHPTAPPTLGSIDGIPLSEFKNWKCWRGYPGYAWKSRHHVHTIAMSGEVGSRDSGDQHKTIKNTDTHDHDHRKAGALEDDTLDGCIEHALHHHFAGLTTQGVTFACHGGSEAWTTVGYKRCEVHTVKEGDSMTTPYGKDHANMGKSGSSSHNYGMILKGRASHVTCLRNEDVHDHWGSRYDSAYEMTLQAARKEYVGCRNNGRTDSGKTHKEHSAHHYDKHGN